MRLCFIYEGVKRKPRGVPGSCTYSPRDPPQRQEREMIETYWKEREVLDRGEHNICMDPKFAEERKAFDKGNL